MSYFNTDPDDYAERFAVFFMVFLALLIFSMTCVRINF